MPRDRFHKSRRSTPWMGREEEMSPAEKMIHYNYLKDHEAHHPPIGDDLEVELINSHRPSSCPFCGAEHFSMKGLDAHGIQRYKCSICGKRFKPTTGTIFDSRRIPLSEWIQYLLNLFQFVSISAGSWNNKNTFQTSDYWLKKVFLILDGYQNDIVLADKIWLDETFYSVVMRDRERDADGNLLRGLSRNQICIGVATDKKQTICIVEGHGRPSQSRSYSTFAAHIKSGSTLVHDQDNTHRKLVNSLQLQSEEYNSKLIKDLPDKENPLYPINHVHFLLKAFLNSHSGFDRSDLDGYLNLFSFMMNPPSEHLEKVAKIFDLGFQNPKTLRYRDLFGLNKHS